MGTAYSIAHPREAIEMTYEVYPTLKPSSGDIEQAIARSSPGGQMLRVAVVNSSGELGIIAADLGC